MSLPSRKVPVGTTAVEARLARLEADLEETSRRYVARLRAEIDAVAAALPKLRPRQAAKAARLLESLQIKPRKGRRKDLKKIDLLVGDLQKLVEG